MQDGVEREVQVPLQGTMVASFRNEGQFVTHLTKNTT